ncbi:hypothetical protein LSAT2_032633 [Lamellibrachia satsuma]|nr:hypothetical protein LSAT2_032633 [Lamellibrachia satsuma]
MTEVTGGTTDVTADVMTEVTAGTTDVTADVMTKVTGRTTDVTADVMTDVTGGVTGGTTDVTADVMTEQKTGLSHNFLQQASKILVLDSHNEPRDIRGDSRIAPQFTLPCTFLPLTQKRMFPETTPPPSRGFSCLSRSRDAYVALRCKTSA